MTTTPTTPHRWFQFSIASLLWLTLVVALILYAVREHDLRVRFETEALGNGLVNRKLHDELMAEKAARSEADSASLRAKLLLETMQERERLKNSPRVIPLNTFKRDRLP
jgi:hypothetical protein